MILYVEKLLNMCLIVALHEHWLYHFEQKEFVEFCNESGFILLGDMNASLTREIPTSRDSGK